MSTKMCNHCGAKPGRRHHNGGGPVYCCAPCRWSETILSQAQSITEAVGSHELYALAVAAVDALTAYSTEYLRVHDAAAEVGVTAEQWAAMRSGRRPGSAAPITGGDSASRIGSPDRRDPATRPPRRHRAGRRGRGRQDAGSG